MLQPFVYSNERNALALSLAVGIIIDDGVIVSENIFRHLEEKGSPPKEAAIVATKEIGLAVMATTLSRVIIFLPVAYSLFAEVHPSELWAKL
ncbi:MAG: efflux RND transporter permease subunit [Acidobacteria bacterium]|nr:efflux RND transporter permease subunit [Acidobacteriota bacterium]